MNELNIFMTSTGDSDERLRRLSTVYLVGMTAMFAVLLGLVGVWGIQNAAVVEERAERRTLDWQRTEALSRRTRDARLELWRVGRRLREGRDQTEPQEFAKRLNDAREALRRVDAPLDHPILRRQWELAETKSLAFLRDAEAIAASGGAGRDMFAIETQVDEVRDELRLIPSVADEVAHERADALTARALTLQERSLVLVIVCGVMAIIGSVVSAVFVRRLFDRLRANREAMNRVSGQLLEKQEVAARHFSQELHDELGQNLTALKAHIARLGRTGGPGDFDRQKQQALAILDTSISTTRNLSQLMHPRVIDDLGLPAAIEWLADGVSERTGIKVDHQVKLSKRLAPDLRHQIFRMAQEALTNIERHSGATNADIKLTENEGPNPKTLVLCVTDNGKGLSSTSMPSKGLGLAGIRARAFMLGGELAVMSGESKGLKLEVTVPAVYEDEQTQDYSIAGGRPLVGATRIQEDS